MNPNGVSKSYRTKINIWLRLLYYIKVRNNLSIVFYRTEASLVESMTIQLDYNLQVYCRIHGCL